MVSLGRWRINLVERRAGLEVIVRREILEETIVVRALTILQAVEMDLTGLLFLCLVNLLTKRRGLVTFKFVDSVKLQCPNHVGRVLDVARLLETLERNGLRVVRAVETADDDKRSVCVALKFLELADGLINAEFR